RSTRIVRLLPSVRAVRGRACAGQPAISERLEASMDLYETSVVDDGDLPVAAFRAHLRLGTGFADEATGDPLLVHYLRAAIATIEGRTGKALLARGFKLILPRWRWVDAQALPVAPVT